jgi:hypothetical protein
MGFESKTKVQMMKISSSLPFDDLSRQIRYWKSIISFIEIQIIYEHEFIPITLLLSPNFFAILAEKRKNKRNISLR